MPMKRASDRRTRSPLNKSQSNGIRTRPILRDTLAASVLVQRLQKTDYTSEQGRKCCLLCLRQSASNAMEWCLEPESNRHDRFGSADFKSAVSTNFTIEARCDYRLLGSALLACREIQRIPMLTSPKICFAQAGNARKYCGLAGT